MPNKNEIIKRFSENSRNPRTGEKFHSLQWEVAVKRREFNLNLRDLLATEKEHILE